MYVSCSLGLTLSMPRNLCFFFLFKCCFTSTETIRLIRDGSPGRPPRLSHSSWALTLQRSGQFNVALRPQKPLGLLGTGSSDGHLDFHTAPESSADAIPLKRRFSRRDSQPVINVRLFQLCFSRECVKSQNWSGLTSHDVLHAERNTDCVRDVTVIMML